MTGGTLPHADISLNIATVLRQLLKGRCKVRNSDAKVGITEAGPFVYPDVSISCDKRDPCGICEAARSAQQFSRYPCLIVEVISPSTKAYDRGGKFALYRRLESLQEYVLVGSETKTVEAFRRSQNGTWAFIPYNEGDEVELASVGLTVLIDAIYEDVILANPQSQKDSSPEPA